MQQPKRTGHTAPLGRRNTCDDALYLRVERCFETAVLRGAGRWQRSDAMEVVVNSNDGFALVQSAGYVKQSPSGYPSLPLRLRHHALRSDHAE